MIITLRQTLVLHEYMVKKYGGSSGIRDMGMLKSAVARPFATFGGEDLYPDIYLKSADLIQSIVKNHPFLDANKRTAFSSAYILLKNNKILMTATQKEVVKFMVQVANKNLSVDEISNWLRKRTKKIG